MRELKQDWRDIFASFRVAFDVWKLVLGFSGVIVTFLVLWGLSAIHQATPDNTGWITAAIVGAILLIALIVKFAASDTGFSASKLVMLIAVAAVMTGLVFLCMYTETAGEWGWIGGVTFLVLMIWAFFGGAITRISAVEITSDDRVSIGEAAGFARKKYGAYLGATILPAVAVLFLALCCTLFGLIFSIPYVCFPVTLLFFFLIPVAGFLMFLIGLGGMAGAPLMYPAVSTEGNDSFDAISRAYSYVFGRPWQYIFYNIASMVYGLACAFFVAFFVKCMLLWSFACVNYGSNGYFNATIRPWCKELIAPLNDGIVGVVSAVSGWVTSWDITGYLARAFTIAQAQLGLEPFQSEAVDVNWAENIATILIAISIYVIVGLVIAYIISLFLSMQTTVYLLLRKSVDGADMAEVYREEDEGNFAVAAEGEKSDESGGAEKKES